MDAEFDEYGMSWKQRASIAEDVIRQATDAGHGAARIVLQGHRSALQEARDLIASKPDMIKAMAFLSARGKPFDLEGVLCEAHRLARRG